MSVLHFDTTPDAYLLQQSGKRSKTSVFEPQSIGELEIEFVETSVWDQLVHMFSDIIPEQMGSYNAGHWGGANLENLIFSYKGEPVGGAVMIVKKIPLTNTGIAILKWGPVFQKQGQDFDAVLYAKFVDSLKKEYCVHRNFHLTIMPAPRPEISDECESVLTAQGFSEGEGLPAPQRYLVNVQDSSETLMGNLDQKWRYNLRKALKNEFDIRIDDTDEGLAEFLNLYQKMIARKQFHDSSAIGALEEFVKNSPRNAKPKVVLVSREGKVTAGGVFHVTGGMASYMFGATDDRALKLKAGYALHWWVAEYLIAQEKVDWYDLGGNDNDQGLHQFKKGFVGKSGHILIAAPRYHFCNSLTSGLIGFAAFEVRNIVASIRQAIHKLKLKVVRG